MDSYKKLQENYSAYRSLNVSTEEEIHLKPLFERIFNGLEAHKGKLIQTAAQLAGEKYSAAYRKEETKKVAAENREKVKANSLLVLDSLKKRLGVCETAVVTASMQGRVVTDPIEKLTQQLRDAEIRSDLAQMDEPKRIDMLFNATKSGDSTVLGALQRAPITKELVPSKELELATQDYLNKVAPTQVDELAFMTDVVEKAGVSLSLMDLALGNIGQQAGIVESAPIRAY